jgi:hypothetical protein
LLSNPPDNGGLAVRIDRVSLRTVLLVGAVGTIAFSAGSIVGAATADQTGTPVSITVHRVPSVAKRHVTWDDSQLTFLPRTTTSIVLTHRSFLILHGVGVSGVECSDVDFQFVSADPAVNVGSANPVTMLSGGVVTPVLAPGTYTVGLAAICQPPDDQNNPGATFQINGTLEIEQVRVP